MIAGTSFEWSSPQTWPFLVYVVLFFIVGNAAWAFRGWWRQQRSRGWPVIMGRIEGPDTIEERIYKSSTAYMVRLVYSYTYGGESYYGNWQRNFDSEEEATEFIRDLDGKPVAISYNPGNPQDSVARDEAIAALVDSRPPAPIERGMQSMRTTVPAWLKALLWPLSGLSAIGLVLSIWIHIGAIAGKKVAPEQLFNLFSMGVFVVWIPTVLVMVRIGGIALKKTPAWVKTLNSAITGYALLNFLIFFIQPPAPAAGGGTSLMDWRLFSSVWIVFYSAALATLFPAALPEDTPGTQPPPAIMR